MACEFPQRCGRLDCKLYKSLSAYEGGRRVYHGDEFISDAKQAQTIETMAKPETGYCGLQIAAVTSLMVFNLVSIFNTSGIYLFS